MKKALVIFKTVEKKYRIRLEALLADRFELVYSEDGEITDDMYEEAEIILGTPPAEKLALCRSLRWLHLGMAGADKFAHHPDLAPEVMLTCSTGAFGVAIAEYMLGYTIMLMKKLMLYRDQQFDGVWASCGTSKSVDGSTVLIVGLGDIGSEFARRMRMMGAYVIGVRRTQAKKPDYVDELWQPDKLDELLPLADTVALCMPNTEETAGMFGIERLVKMKPGAILINVGRGSAVVTDELVQVLESGHLGGAALDVLEQEPLPSDHPLWRMPNVIITPHVSGGGTNLAETYEKILELMLENVRLVVNDREPMNIVDRKTGYRRAR